MTRGLKHLAMAAMLVWSGNAFAASGVVSAKNPQSIVDALKGMGSEATLNKEDSGEPWIQAKVDGWNMDVFFYGCDDKKLNCDSVQFGTLFTPDPAISESKAMEFVKGYRFAALYLNDKKEVSMSWDLLLLDGIPLSHFEASVRKFSSVMTSLSDFLYPKEDEEEEATAAPAKAK